MLKFNLIGYLPTISISIKIKYIPNNSQKLFLPPSQQIQYKDQILANIKSILYFHTLQAQ